MIKFILKGILRDSSRSLLPIIIISIGVFLTVFLTAYLNGVMNDLKEQTAKFDTGHVKVMTKAYLKEIDQNPLDLSILNSDQLTQSLTKSYPEYQWVNRIKFGGIIDIPDQLGNSKGQGPAAGFAISLFDKSQGEIERFNLKNALKTGVIPEKSGKVLIGHDFAEKLKLKPGNEITLMGSTMNGSLMLFPLKISGTIKFGMKQLDQGAIIVDISDARKMVDMENASSEILGFSKSGKYDNENAELVSNNFNLPYKTSKDEFAPIMLPLKQQKNLAELIDYTDNISGIFIFIFVLAMSVVLWNTGLLGGIRRYKEIGIRLSMGESKPVLYKNMIIEATIIGIIGSIIGTSLGILVAYYLQTVGIDISEMMKNSTMFFPPRVRAEVSPSLFYIGFIPGVLAMVAGTMLSGIGIFKRQTSQLFKELEV
ncbi:MAG: FtsX-like permease family protein [Cytophagaceae bacterium]|nr:FtsX-like permease family protein [Cytophagaceae bacterium]